MMTIHDISILDNWTGTRSYGTAGDEILRILKKHNLTPEFDVQDLWDEKGNLKDSKYIISGIPHNSVPESNVIKLIFSEINPAYLPELWNDDDFIRVDREHATSELNKLHEKIAESQKHAGLRPSERPDRSDLLVKSTLFGFISEIRGVRVGITPQKFYKCPDAKYSTDENGVRRMVSHLPEGNYTFLRILNNNIFAPVCLETFWVKSDSELLNIIDRKRGKFGIENEDLRYLTF